MLRDKRPLMKHMYLMKTYVFAEKKSIHENDKYQIQDTGYI